ncbi:XdhC family protein [Hoyosella sp. G463]|uniref:XdhC family protein n=1 Tax=Lolliginicoccus lacisalsi TaxID=2742202 RepID=A0A927JD26_9ACTN|nr:XdhC/CoxI family protein [Lolliginicoccus lacisalsi]MBD8507098.1 XdhC family protein [Lolliginicoccus lacisalsi]
MREILPWLHHRVARDGACGLVTVIATRGSAPREPGAAMAVDMRGEVAGGVSGGCVEADAHARAMRALSTGIAERVGYGPGGEPGGISLTCGGQLEVLVERVDTATFPGLAEVCEAVAAGRPATVGVVITDGEAPGHRLGQRGTSVAGKQFGIPLREDMLAIDFVGVPRMLILGSTPHVAAMAAMGRFLGFAVTVCDQRPVFTTSARFPGAHEVVVARPAAYLDAEIRRGRVDHRTVVLVMTHSDGVDVDVLQRALGGDEVLGFVGALGSSATALRRREELRRRGVGEAELAMLVSPVGLGAAGRMPEEVAVSIAAQLVAGGHAKAGGAERVLGPTGAMVLQG